MSKNWISLVNAEQQDKTALESLIERGVMDERDIDFLNHLQVPEIDQVTLEGIIGAAVKNGFDNLHGAFNDVNGWFKGIESKRKYILEICDDLIDWLKDKDADNHNLNLDMGTIKTWMKTSETFYWRFYFLLNNDLWQKIEADLKSGKISDLETIYDVNFSKRKDVTQELDSIADIKTLIKVVETYKQRTNKFFDLILKRKTRIKSFPFQIILLGVVDLRKTLKKIVNLAL